MIIMHKKSPHPTRARRSVRRFFTVCLPLTVSVAFAAETPLFTEAEVFKFSPRARKDYVKELTKNQSILLESGITRGLRLAHFFAQIATETNGLKRLDENLYYTKDRLLCLGEYKKSKCPVFKAITTEQKAIELAGKRKELANWVYGDRPDLGNLGRESDDGWNYRGSGFIQLTGRTNFKERGREIKRPLDEKPDLVRTPFVGLLAATAYWSAKGINDAAENDDIRRVRKLINPALQGLDVAMIWYRQATKAFPVESSSASEDAVLAAASDSESAAVADALEDLGFLEPSKGRESAPEREETISKALRAYQKSRGLSETGTFDEDTLYSITDPREWRVDSTAAEDPTEEVPKIIGDPEETVTYDMTSGTGGIAASGAKTLTQPPSKLEKGTGALSGDTNLSQQELSLFANSKAAYAPYEEEEKGRRNKEGDFIPYSVFGDVDGRVPVLSTTTFPASAIVQIRFTSRLDGRSRLCTGALIFADTVLTAGHCLHSGTVSGNWYTDFVVYPGRGVDTQGMGTQPFGSCTASRLYTLNGWVNTKNVFDARQYDLGAMKLSCDVGRRTGWFDLRAINDEKTGTPVTVQGYPIDKNPKGRQWKSNDEIRQLQNLNIFYQNDTYGGMSGSPVYREGENKILAIHTSGRHGIGPWSTNNSASRITRDRFQTITHWIRN